MQRSMFLVWQSWITMILGALALVPSGEILSSWNLIKLKTIYFAARS